MTYPYTVVFRQGREYGGGATRYKSFETARKHLKDAIRRGKEIGKPVDAWQIVNLETMRTEEASGRM